MLARFERGKQKKPKSFIWIDQNGSVQSNKVEREDKTSPANQLPRRPRRGNDGSAGARTVKHHPRNQENIHDLLRIKRMIGRMYYTKLIKVKKMESYEKTAQEAEDKLRSAEKMLQRDEKTFDDYLRKYMDDHQERENQDQVTRSEFLSQKRELENRIRNTKLQISSIEQSIFQLEDTVKDQNQLKDLLARKVDVSRSEAAEEEETSISDRKSKDNSNDGTDAIKPSDILDFVLHLLGLEEKNFTLMQEIQKREELLIEMRRSLADCSTRTATRVSYL